MASQTYPNLPDRDSPTTSQNYYTTRAKVVILPKRPTTLIRARSEYGMSYMRSRPELSPGVIRTQQDVAEAIAMSNKMFLGIPVLCIGTFVVLGFLGWMYVAIWHPERLAGWHNQRIAGEMGRRGEVFAWM